MTSELVIGISTAVLTSVIGPIAVHYVKLMTQNKKHDPLAESIEVNEMIISKMESIRTEQHADRMWLLQFHNGGHFYPTGKSIQKFSMVYEVLSNNCTPCQHQFQNIPVSLFSKSINVLHKGDIISIEDTSNMDRKYEGFTSVIPGAGVKSTYMFPIYNIKDRFIGIVGIDFCSKKKDLSESDLNDIGLETSTIGGVLDKYLSF